MVIIKEQKTGKIVCRDAIVCSSMWSQARGLILSRRKNLLFVFPKPTIARLHMIFVLFPIDVVGIDLHGKVACVTHLTPFSFWKSQAPLSYILEISKKPFSLPSSGKRLKIKT